MARPNTKALLNEILSDDIEWVYVHITDKAVEWALAGYIDEANNLLEHLWKFNLPHSENLRAQDEGLQVLWTVSKRQPSNIPFTFQDTTKIEQRNFNELAFIGQNAGYVNSENISDTLLTIRGLLETNGVVGYGYFLAATYGAILAARNSLDDETKYFIKAWVHGYDKNWTNYTPSYLLRDRKSVEYLLKGTLAPVFKLDKELCIKETEEIINQLNNRILKGRTLVYKDLSWHQLLTSISKLAIEQKTTDFSNEVLLRRSLCRRPATFDEIISAEERLSVKLPDEYKNFLLTSNGFEGYSYTGVVLASVDKVDFYRNFDEDLVESWADSMEEFDATYGEKLRNSIIIGGHEEEQQLLLVPLDGSHWECWHFSSWQPGEAVYESFRFYMEDELQKLESGFHSD